MINDVVGKKVLMPFGFKCIPNINNSHLEKEIKYYIRKYLSSDCKTTLITKHK